MKLVFVPSIWLALPLALRPYLTQMQILGNPFMDFANNIQFSSFFILGYILTAADDQGMKEVIFRGRWVYIVVGLTINVSSVLGYNPLPLGYLLSIWTAGGSWLIVLGLFAVMREMVTTSHSFLSLLSQIAMPFYIMHQQILVAILTWVGGFGGWVASFTSVLFLTTIVTSFVSLVIVKCGPFRYWFGLNPPKGSILPGDRVSGFIPLILMLILLTLVYGRRNLGMI